MESYHGHIRTQIDAILLFEASRMGFIPRIRRRLSERERLQIASGSIYIWDEHEASMRRWTDGKSWSASRVSGSFLTYREMEGSRKSSGAGAAHGGGSPTNHHSSSPSQSDDAHTPSNGSTSHPGSRKRKHPDPNHAKRSSPGASPTPSDDSSDVPEEGYRYKQGGLFKQSFSITTSTQLKFHLIAYYTKEDVASGKLIQPSTDPRFKDLRIPNEMYPDNSSSGSTFVPAITTVPLSYSSAYQGYHPHLPPPPLSSSHHPHHHLHPHHPHHPSMSQRPSHPMYPEDYAEYAKHQHEQHLQHHQSSHSNTQNQQQQQLPYYPPYPGYYYPPPLAGYPSYPPYRYPYMPPDSYPYPSGSSAGALPPPSSGNSNSSAASSSSSSDGPSSSSTPPPYHQPHHYPYPPLSHPNYPQSYHSHHPSISSPSSAASASSSTAGTGSTTSYAESLRGRSGSSASLSSLRSDDEPLASTATSSSTTLPPLTTLARIGESRNGSPSGAHEDHKLPSSLQKGTTIKNSPSKEHEEMGPQSGSNNHVHTKQEDKTLNSNSNSQDTAPLAALSAAAASCLAKPIPSVSGIKMKSNAEKDTLLRPGDALPDEKAKDLSIVGASANSTPTSNSTAIAATKSLVKSSSDALPTPPPSTPGYSGPLSLSAPSSGFSSQQSAAPPSGASSCSQVSTTSPRSATLAAPLAPSSTSSSPGASTAYPVASAALSPQNKSNKPKCLPEDRRALGMLDRVFI